MPNFELRWTAICLWGVAVALGCGSLATPAAAQDRVVITKPSGANIRREIHRPYSHPIYNVELEPHFVGHWTDRPFRTDVGVGIGFRASIPIIQRGPIRTLNNNLAISFGADWSHFSVCRRDEPDCDGNDFRFPIVMQWNFFLLPWWSVFPEAGIAIHHARWGWRCDRGGDCRVSDYNTGVSPAFWLGTRFSLSDMFSFTLRMGYPSFLAGISFRI